MVVPHARRDATSKTHASLLTPAGSAASWLAFDSTQLCVVWVWVCTCVQVTQRGLSVAVVSSDSDMQQVLSVGPLASWIEVLQLPGRAVDHVTALHTEALQGTMTWLPLRLHRAQDSE